MAELGCEAALLIHEGAPFLVFWGGSNVQGLKLRGSGDSLHSELCKQSLQHVSCYKYMADTCGRKVTS